MENLEVILANEEKGESLSAFQKNIGGSSPADSYLITLNSLASRTTMTSILKRTVLILAKLSGFKFADEKEVDHNCFDWRLLNKDIVTRLIDHLDKDLGLKIATQRLYLAAVKGVVEACYDKELIAEKAFIRIKKISVSGSTKTKVNTVSTEQILEIYEASGNDVVGVRDTAIIALLLGGGLRRSEAANLKMEQILFNEKGLLFSGKGNKERSVYLSDKNWHRLKTYLDEVRGYDTEDQYVFGRFWKGGTLDVTRPLTAQGIYIVLKKVIKRCETVAELRPHDLRRKFATSLYYDSNVPLKTIRDMLGHSSVSTTEIYIGVNETQLKEAGRSFGH